MFLDALRAEDGQPVNALGALVPTLGRHAVLKHLRVLEDSGLVTSVKSGRQRLMYLNAVPIVELAQRWLDAYSTQSALALNRLKSHLEMEKTVTVNAPTTRTVRAAIIVEATPTAVWRALTDPEETRRWYFGTWIRSTFEPGTPLEYVDASGTVQIRGTVVDVVTDVRLVHTFAATWSDEVSSDAESVYRWDLDPLTPSTTKITIVHSGVPQHTQTEAEVEEGAVLLLSALKTLLETGHSLAVAVRDE